MGSPEAYLGLWSPKVYVVNSFKIVSPLRPDNSCIIRFKPLCIGVTRCRMMPPLNLRTRLGFCLYSLSGRRFVTRT